MADEFRVIQASRQVIESKLLTALDEGAVAILASKDDVDLFIAVLRATTNTKAHELAEGLERLRREAFGEA